MASNFPYNNAGSKVSNVTSQTSPASSQVGPSQGADVHSNRRQGGSGSFGAGATTRASSSAPRNKQASKNQHKSSRRFRLADEDAIAESTAMRPFNNRKGQTSITHLMNFSLPPRPSHFHQNIHNRNARRNPTWGLGSGYHAIDKARYVHANYRFLVDPRHDYHAQSVDADVYLDWNSILQVLASPQSQAAACPICLGDPVAPRMAKCGHIFCLPCLIRYMHSTDDSHPSTEKRARWKACPICWDSIYVSETRPVRWYTGQEGTPPTEGSDIVLRLVMRNTGSTLALPRESSSALQKGEDIPWHFTADVMDFTRVMKGSEDYMISQYDVEIQELDQLEKHDELMFGEDTEWTRRAIKAVRDAKERIKGIGNPPASLLKPEEPKPKKKPIVFRSDDDEGVPLMYTIQHAAKSGQSLSSNVLQTNEDAEVRNQDDTSDTEQVQGSHEPSTADSKTSALSSSLAQFKARQNASHGPSEYYFYQALLHYYLSPLDIRILKAAFGDFSSFPSTILPRVEHVSTGHVVDDDLRKRAKYLAHLPHGCEVGFLECDWTDTVPEEILAKFKHDIERRRKKNQEKETREEKSRARAEKEEEDRRYAAARRNAPISISHTIQPDDFQPLTATEGADVSGSEIASESGHVTGSTSPVWTSRRTNGSSFASLASPSTSPNAQRTVWGTTVIAPTSPPLQAAPVDPNPADDGWLQGWEKDLLQEDDLIAQAQAMSLSGESSKQSTSSSKKKKGKKITLMSTNARRGA